MRDRPVLRPPFHVVEEDGGTRRGEIDCVGRGGADGVGIPFDRDRLPRLEDLTPRGHREGRIHGGDARREVPRHRAVDDRLPVRFAIQVLVGEDERIDGVLERLVARIGGEEEVALDHRLEDRLASHVAVHAGEGGRPVAPVAVDRGRRSGIFPNVRPRRLVGSVDPAQRVGAAHRRGTECRGPPVGDRGPVVLGRLVGRIPLVEIEHPGEEVAKPFPHRPLFRRRAGAPARHLVVLDRMAIFVDHDVGVLARIDTTVTEVDALVVPAVEGILGAEVVGVRRNRTVVDVVEAERLLEVALKLIDRVVHDDFLEAVVGAGEVEIVGGRPIGVGGLAGGFVRPGDPGGAEIDEGTDEDVVRKPLQRDEGACRRQFGAVGVAVVAKIDVAGVLEGARVVHVARIEEEFVPLRAHLAALRIDEEAPVAEGIEGGDPDFPDEPRLWRRWQNEEAGSDPSPPLPQRDRLPCDRCGGRRGNARFHRKFESRYRSVLDELHHAGIVVVDGEISLPYGDSPVVLQETDVICPFAPTNGIDAEIVGGDADPIAHLLEHLPGVLHGITCRIDLDCRIEGSSGWGGG